MSRVEFNIYKDLEKVNANSLLIESGTEVAGLQIDNVYLSLMCYGEVNIDYKGKRYKNPNDYPKEITDYLLGKTDKIDDSFCVSDNNWFVVEVFIIPNRKYGVLISVKEINDYIDTFDIEGELESEYNSLSERLYKILLNYFRQLKEEYQDKVPELKEIDLKNL